MDRADLASDRYAPLSTADRVNLNCWGRAYNLQHDGFTRSEAVHLAFLGLLIQNGLFSDDRAPAEEV